MLPRRPHRPIRPVWYLLHRLQTFPEDSPLENRQEDLKLKYKIADSQMGWRSNDARENRIPVADHPGGWGRDVR
jgi:hypothetical protein